MYIDCSQWTPSFDTRRALVTVLRVDVRFRDARCHGMIECWRVWCAMICAVIDVVDVRRDHESQGHEPRTWSRVGHHFTREPFQVASPKPSPSSTTKKLININHTSCLHARKKTISRKTSLTKNHHQSNPTKSSHWKNPQPQTRSKKHTAKQH